MTNFIQTLLYVTSSITKNITTHIRKISKDCTVNYMRGWNGCWKWAITPILTFRSKHVFFSFSKIVISNADCEKATVIVALECEIFVRVTTAEHFSWKTSPTAQSETHNYTLINRVLPRKSSVVLFPRNQKIIYVCESEKKESFTKNLKIFSSSSYASRTLHYLSIYFNIFLKYCLILLLHHSDHLIFYRTHLQFHFVHT